MRKSNYIQDEMDALKHPATGEYFTSKAKFRAKTKELGLEECYGEEESIAKIAKWNPEEDIAEDILKAEELINYGESVNYEEKERCRLMDKKMEWEAN